MRTEKEIILTPGEPAGIGPDITVLALTDPSLHANIHIIADPDLLHARAKALNCTFNIDNKKIKITPIKLNEKAIPGKLNPNNAEYVIKTLDTAIEHCLKNPNAALVTGPIHKANLNHLIPGFSGHTEYLAQKTNTKNVVMMLASDDLRVALVTTHLPLKEVPNAITKEKLTKTIEVLHHALEENFSLKHQKPRIAICGLNPHAGEDGTLGHEEIETIIPVVNNFRKKGFDLIGPLPADTAFTEKVTKDCDAILAMYHDQGLPVLKYAGFSKAVNITLGLPFVRTSVDHGTALEIAGTGRANVGSLIQAIRLASS